jgi:hypothetical protein
LRSPDLPQHLLDGSLAGLTSRGSAIVTAIVRSNGRFVSSTSFAREVGLRDRHELDRVLHNEGFPTYKVLSGWIRVLTWVLEWESTRVALSRSALGAGVNAEVYGRTVQRVTGLSWTKVRSRGSSWVLLELVGRCRPRQVRPSAVDSHYPVVSNASRLAC